MDRHRQREYVLYGGEFTRVNGVAQQGLVRFAMPSIAPNREGLCISGGTIDLTAMSIAPGTARVAWPTNWDYDNETLTYGSTAVRHDTRSTRRP